MLMGPLIPLPPSSSFLKRAHRDMIIGLSDGLTVPFGLTAGLAAIGSSKIVVVGGIAELISGALSMGVGGALGTQAERELVGCLAGSWPLSGGKPANSSFTDCHHTAPPLSIEHPSR